MARELMAAARREDEEYPRGSLTDEQHRRGLKDLSPYGLSNGGPLAALLLSHRAQWLCSFVAPCQRSAITQRTPSYL
ncbi:MAG: hypothetical protein QOG67_2312 [Verrucomicrobiota bacterium]